MGGTALRLDDCSGNRSRIYVSLGADLSQPDINTPMQHERRDSQVRSLLELVRLTIKDNQSITICQLMQMVLPHKGILPDAELQERLRYAYFGMKEGYLIIPTDWDQ